QRALPIGGEFFECGVFRGGSASLIADVLKESPRPFRLFDTFRGFEGVGPNDLPGVKNGRMFHSETAADEVKTFLGNPDFVSFHIGAVPETFRGLNQSVIAFAHLDLDLYEPTKAALAFVLPRLIRGGGTVVIDDYGDPDWPGVEKAVSHIVDAHIEVAGTQAVIRW